MEVTVAALRAKYRVLSATLDERALRLCAAGDAKMFGYGGISFVAKAAGLSRTTLHAGLAKKVADTGSPLAEGRIRQAGGGRKLSKEKDETLLADLDRSRARSRSRGGTVPAAMAKFCGSLPTIANQLRVAHSRGSVNSF